MTDEQLRYPTGRFTPPQTYLKEDLTRWINEIHILPGRVQNTIATLTDQQLDTQYRPGGWTLRQVVHHLADSHMNALMRFKLALTEDNPTIRPYDEAGWALLPDYHLPLAPSLKMLEGIHQHLVALFESFTDEQWNLTFIHPETGNVTPLKKNLAIYAWHGNHHLAHLTETIKRF